MAFSIHVTAQNLRACLAFASNWILSFLRVQLVLFLVALPILSLWGLPLSYASIIGNFLFAPWATVFLGLSTLWLISHVCGIPNTLLVYGIEYITTWWLWCLSYGSSRMLFAIPAPHPLIALIIPLTGILVLYSTVRSKWGLSYEVLLLGCLSVGWCWALSTWAKARTPIPIAHGGGNVWLYPTDQGVNLIDKEGVLRNLGTSSSWLTFSLPSALARNFGTCSCHDIVIFKPTIHRLNAAAALIKAKKGKRLVVPTWLMKKKWWLSWKKKHEDIEVGAAHLEP